MKNVIFAVIALAVVLVATEQASAAALRVRQRVVVREKVVVEQVKVQKVVVQQQVVQKVVVAQVVQKVAFVQPVFAAQVLAVNACGYAGYSAPVYAPPAPVREVREKLDPQTGQVVERITINR